MIFPHTLDLLLLKYRRSLVDLEHINQRAAHDMSRFGEWRCDYAAARKNLQATLGIYEEQIHAIELKQIGERGTIRRFFRFARAGKGLSLRQAGEATGLGVVAISDIELGKRAPSQTELDAMEEAYAPTTKKLDLLGGGQ